MPTLSLELVLIAGRIIVLAGSLLILAIAFNRWRRNAERDAQRVFEQLDLVRIELLLLTERMERRESITAVSEHSDTAPTPVVSGTSSSRGYELAARLARGGATCEELIRSCGVSRHEAELLLRLHNAEAARSKDAAKTSDKPLVSDERRARLSVVG
ncbi:MAG: DUF2802 domain-containing protein [Steroidobacteraceae bacterium]